MKSLVVAGGLALLSVGCSAPPPRVIVVPPSRAEVVESATPTPEPSAASTSWETAQAAVDSAQAQLDAAQAGVDSAQAQRDAAQAQLDAARAQLDAARIAVDTVPDVSEASGDDDSDGSRSIFRKSSQTIRIHSNGKSYVLRKSAKTFHLGDSDSEEPSLSVQTNDARAEVTLSYWHGDDLLKFDSGGVNIACPLDQKAHSVQWDGKAFLVRSASGALLKKIALDSGQPTFAFVLTCSTQSSTAKGENESKDLASLSIASSKTRESLERGKPSRVYSLVP